MSVRRENEGLIPVGARVGFAARVALLLPDDETTNIPPCPENHEMRVSWLLAWVGSFAVAAAGLAAEQPETAVERLILQLSSASAAARDEAERTLLGLGPALLPRVIAARRGAAGEADFRLRCLQHHLEEMATAEGVETAVEALSFSVDAIEPVADGRRIRIPVRVTWGPAVEPLAMRLPVGTIMADGPAGEALPPVQRQAIVEPLIAAGATTASLPLILTQVDPPLESLATLRGTLTLWIAGREHDFEIPLDGSPRSLRVGRASVAVLAAATQEDHLEIMASITFDEPSEALASHRPWLAARGIDVVGPDGQLLPRTEQRTAARSERGLTAVASFTLPAHGGGLRGLSMRWRLPMAIHEVPVDFLVRDVPLPKPSK